MWLYIKLANFFNPTDSSTAATGKPTFLFDKFLNLLATSGLKLFVATLSSIHDTVEFLTSSIVFNISAKSLSCLLVAL